MQERAYILFHIQGYVISVLSSEAVAKQLHLREIFLGRRKWRVSFTVSLQVLVCMFTAGSKSGWIFLECETEFSPELVQHSTFVQVQWNLV